MSTPSHAFHPAAHAVDHSLSDAENKKAWFVFGAFVVGLTAAYWNMLTFTSSFWDNDLYSHGWIVPVFAAVLFWLRSRLTVNLSSKEVQVSGAILVACVSANLLSNMGVFEMTGWMGLIEVIILLCLYLYHISRSKLTEVAPGERWIGVGIIAICLLVRLWASYIDMNPLDRLTYIGALLGVCQLVGGFAMLRWAGPPLGFLVFMFPLPSVIEGPILLTLQKMAAMSSEWTLQLLGVPALRDGNRIMIDQLPLDVADACSGLRMGTIFGAMSVAMAMIINRPWWDRLTILLSAVPIALLTNVIRITATALLYMAFPESETVKHYVHDWAGFLMMPVALGFLWVELQLLSRITVPLDTDDYTAFDAVRS
ncbi:MAG: exosortase/archaeosortase family protein [Planctomycetales bacterium]|nr:exosortase/archaeosortase family protein [Planctomycetales bacterium]